MTSLTKILNICNKRDPKIQDAVDKAIKENDEELATEVIKMSAEQYESEAIENL